MKKISSIVLFSAILLSIEGRATDLVQLSEREEVRRQEHVQQGERLAVRAALAAKEKNLKLAYKDYLEALHLIPAGSATSSSRQAILADFSRTAIDYARRLIEEGNYAEAENVAKTVLSPEFNPTYKPAAQILSQLEKGNFNTTLDPKFAASRDEVSKWLNQAEGFYATGRYDLAIKRYEQVLNIDPYNMAARNGMEQVNQQRTDYYKEAYNETRSRMLWLVDREWERPVRKLGGARSSEAAALVSGEAVSSKDEMLRKLNSIVIDNVSLNDVTIREAVEILKQKSREFDTGATDPKKRGVNIVLKIPPAPSTESPDTSLQTDDENAANTHAVSENTKVSLDLRNIPLIEALKYLTELSNLKQKIEPYAVSLVPIGTSTEELVVKEYRVSPGFIPPSEEFDSSSNQEPGGGSTAAAENQRIKGGKNATAYLKQQGVPFPEGAFAQYIPSGSKLVVRNTQGALDLVDTLVEGDVGVKPTQVEIESKFVEISQTNVNELGFDWLVGPFSIGGGMYGDGGTRAGDLPLNTNYYNNFPFGTVGSNPLTAGNRNGVGTSVNSAITANSLSALLAGVPTGTNVASPGIFGIAGVFTNPQFQMVIRALSQQKGVDLMSAPKVTTKSGNTATINITRDFPFPSEFDPPQVPPPATSSSSGGDSGNNMGIVTTSGMVTPATPTAFENRALGVILQVEPQIGADNYTIDLNLSPEVVEFDGFVNYGSPIIGPRYDPGLITTGDLSGIGTFEVTPNVMNQPVFSVRKVETSVSLWDGQTVALGGLIREDVQKVNDKVPILGDIPLAGRLFRSNVDQKIKKNLLIFVTARLLDAAGQPLLQEDEAEEIVEPLGLPEDLPAPRFESRSRGK